jgi:3-isopropylmalate/(R)-2-methylmalate dehydratase small subunit
MEPFKTIDSVAAVIDQSDIDTDMILPAQFLLRIDREGLGQFAFHGVRQDPAKPFILDIPPFNTAKVIIGGERMGIGSSREQAVWSLVDFGIRCVIAPSFGEIFYANCFKNGVLAITMDGAPYEALKIAASAGARLHIDLEKLVLTCGENQHTIDVTSHQREGLLLGRDETAGILVDDLADIKAFETRQKTAAPWLYLSEDQLSTYYSHLDRSESE